MRTAGVAFLISILIAAAMTPAVRRMAFRYGLLDHAISSRKIHGRPIPRLGGIAIIAGFLVPLLTLAGFETSTGALFYQNRLKAVALLVAVVVIGLLGVYDDLKGANAKKKFAVQISLAVGLYLAGYQINHVATPFGAAIALGPFALPFTVLWIVGVVNALNLIDGLDGLAGGVAFFAVGTTFIIALYRGDGLMMLFMACLGGAVLGFLIYNFNPASIFMGDTGSMFLGLVLAASSIQTNQKASTAVAILVPVIVLGLPIADTLLAMTRRAMRGRPLFSADREHIHHRLLALGMSHRKAVLTLYGACVLLAGTALLLTFASSTQASVLLAFLVISFIVGMRMLGFMRLKQSADMGLQRQRNRNLRAAVKAISGSLAIAGNEEDLWLALRGFAEHVAADGVSLSLGGSHSVGGTAPNQFSSGFLSGTGVRAVFEIGCEGLSRGELVFSWNDGRAEIDRDDEIAIEILCDHVNNAWARLRGGTKQLRKEAKGNLTVVR